MDEVVTSVDEGVPEVALLLSLPVNIFTIIMISIIARTIKIAV